MNTVFISHVCIYELKHEPESNDARLKCQNKYPPKSNRKFDYNFRFERRWMNKNPRRTYLVERVAGEH